MPGTLIGPAELARSLHREDWAIVDCRFDLARPGWGGAEFASGHIPGAVYAHLDRDLSGPLATGSGRHPLPTPAALAATLAGFGIGPGTQVVAYDQGNGAIAARLWWLVRWAGHQAVAVLDGGFAAWRRSGLPIEAGTQIRPRAGIEVAPDDRRVVGAAQLEKMIADGTLARGDSALVDARGADRFAGENESLDPVAGHIPGARNHPFASNLDADGAFLPPQELRQRWLRRLGHTAAASSIMMCGSGVTACHNLLALEIAGLSGARLYPGSWSEWITDASRPIARGAD